MGLTKTVMTPYGPASYWRLKHAELNMVTRTYLVELEAFFNQEYCDQMNPYWSVAMDGPFTEDFASLANFDQWIWDNVKGEKKETTTVNFSNHVDMDTNIILCYIYQRVKNVDPFQDAVDVLEPGQTILITAHNNG